MKIKLFKVASMLLAAALFAVPACTDYSADIAEVKGDVKSLQSSLSTLESSVSSLQTTVSSLQTQLTTTETNLKKAIADQKTELQAELQAKYDSLKALIDECNAEITAAQAAIAEINDKLAKDEADIAELQQTVAKHTTEIANLTARVEALEANVDALMAALQSVVFMPENSDGSATINVLGIWKNKKNAKNKTEAYVDYQKTTSYFDFVVTPATQAANLATLVEKGDLTLSFNAVNVLPVKADVCADTLFKLDVTGVAIKDATKGIVTVAVEPTIKDEAFEGDNGNLYTNNHSVALLVKAPTIATEVSSSFFNTDIKVKSLVYCGLGSRDEDNNVIIFDSKENPYNVTDLYTQFDGYEPVYCELKSVRPQAVATTAELDLGAPEGWYLASELKDLFDIDPDVYYYLKADFRQYYSGKTKAKLDKDLIALFKVNDADTCKVLDAKPTLTVQLDPDSKDAARKALASAQAYQWVTVISGLDSLTTARSYAMFAVTKAQVVENATCETAEWNYTFGDLGATGLAENKPAYEKCINGDAVWAEDTQEHAYEREGSSELHLTFKDWASTLATLKTLGLDLTKGKQIFNADSTNASCVIKVGKDTLDYEPVWEVQLGNKSESNHFSWLAETPVCRGFDFGKDYTVKFTVSTDYLDFIVNFDFNTEDRNRDLMSVNLGDSTFVYTKGNLEKTVKGINDLLWDIAADRNFVSEYDFKEPDFLAALSLNGWAGKATCNKATPWLSYDFAGKISARVPQVGNLKDSLGFKPLTVKDTVKVKTGWRQDYQVAWNVSYTVPDFDLDAIESGAVKYDSIKKYYYAQAVGDYKYYGDKKLDKYVVLPVSLNNLFQESKDEKLLTDAKAEELGLSKNFEIPLKYVESKSAQIDPSDTTLTFNAGVTEVPVKGTLYIDGYADENVDYRFVIPSNFENGGMYSNFTVKNANPIALFAPVVTKDTLTIETQYAKQENEYDAYKNFVMHDTDGNRILWEEEDSYYPDEDEIGKYAYNTRKYHAFGKQARTENKSDYEEYAQKAYGNGFTDIYYSLSGVPAGLENNVTIDSSTGVITVTGLNNVEQCFDVTYNAWFGSDYYGKDETKRTSNGKWAGAVTLTIQVVQ